MSLPGTSVRELLRLTLPIMGSLLTSIAMMIIDGLMCGHISDGGLSLTALGFGVQIWFLLAAPAVALSVGTVALVSRAHGANEPKRVSSLLVQSSQLSLVIGGVITLLTIMFGSAICRFLGAGPEVAAKATGYLQMFAIGFPGLYLAEGSVAATLRAVGKPRIPFIAGLASNVLNIVLVYALVFGHFGLPAMGLRGAGLATALALNATVVLQIIAIRFGAVEGVTYPIRFMRVERELVDQIIKVGLPAFVEQTVFYGSMTMLVWVLARIDETSVAAHSIGSRMAALLMIPVSALSMATATLSGKALGANSPDDARAALRIAATASLIVMVPIGLATWFGATWITAAYDIASGSKLEGFAVTYLHLISYTMVLQGLMMAFEGLLEGAGASKTVMKINLTANLGLRVTLALVLGLCTNLGAWGVWLSWPAALCVQLPLAYIAYRRGTWAKTGVTV